MANRNVQLALDGKWVVPPAAARPQRLPQHAKHDSVGSRTHARMQHAARYSSPTKGL